MKRKTSELPSRVWTFGCLPPTENAAAVLEQMRLAHRYKNALIAIELMRRTTIRKAQAKLPDVQPFAAKVEALKEACDAMQAELKAARSKARKRIDIAPLRGAIQVLKVELKTARAALKAIKKTTADDPTFQLVVVQANTDADTAIKAARANCGVYWGTYLLIENAVQAACAESTDPRFKPWREYGRIGVNIQHGMAVHELTSNTCMQIAPVQPEAYTATSRGVRRRAARTTLRMRIGSNADRSPIWARFPIILHRKLPDDARIKDAWVKRTKIGTRFRWELQIAMESDTFRQAKAQGFGTVAVDIGWRQRESNSLRIAYTLDEFGEGGEIQLSARIRGALDHVDSLQAIRDKNFDAARDKLTAFMAGTVLSVWLPTTAETLALWKSPHRLTRLVWDWREYRFPGDETIFASLEHWRRQERHLYQWQSNERETALLSRKDFYRNVACGLAKRYDTIVLEKFDLRTMAELPEPEACNPKPKVQRRNRHNAALSEFRRAIEAAAALRGAAAPKVNPAYTTQVHAACGCDTPWDAAPQIMHKCSGCGEVFDQDRNACENMLMIHASGQAASDVPDALAGSNTLKTEENIESNQPETQPTT